jgi:multidrug resistance efflux pump
LRAPSGECGEEHGASTEADLKNAVALKNQAAVRLGYTNVYAPVSGTVSVRAARQGEVVNIGAPIVTIVDLSDTWARAAIPETYADHIGYGDVLRVRLPGGTVTSGKVFFKGSGRRLRYAARREPDEARHQEPLS